MTISEDVLDDEPDIVAVVLLVLRRRGVDCARALTRNSSAPLDHNHDSDLVQRSAQLPKEIHSSAQDRMPQNLSHLKKPSGKNWMGRGKLPVHSCARLRGSSTRYNYEQIYIRSNKFLRHVRARCVQARIRSGERHSRPPRGEDGPGVCWPRSDLHV